MNFSELQNLIKQHRHLKKKYPGVHNLPASQYDIYRRYTTTQKDHAPQLRASRNIRKPLPIVAQSKKLPKFHDTYRLKGDKEMGESKLSRVSAVAPDWWSKYGEPGDGAATDAILEPEREKVKRYFQADLKEVNFDKGLPMRKHIKARPTLGNVQKWEVNSTLLAVLFPDDCTDEDKSKVDAVAKEGLEKLINQYHRYKSMESLVNIARYYISPEYRWFPLHTTVSPFVAELIHAVFSPYFHVLTKWEEDPELLSIERLCYEIVNHSLTHQNPLERLRHLLATGLIGRKSITEALESVSAGKPFLNICRAAAGLRVSYNYSIRGTSFVVLSTEAFPVLETLVTNLSGNYSWTWFKGKETVYYESKYGRGIIHKEDRKIQSISLEHLESNIMPMLVDIAYYCKAIKTGLDVMLPFLSTPKDHVRNILALHTEKPSEVIDAFGVTQTRYIVDIFGNIPPVHAHGLLKIYPLEMSAQGYTAHNIPIKINKNLVVSNAKDGRVLVDPGACRIPELLVPRPAGLNMTRCDNYTLFTAPKRKFNEAFKTLFNNDAKLKRYCEHPEEVPQDLQVMLGQSVTVKPLVRAAYKRRLSDASQNFSVTPEKKIRVITDLAGYFCPGKPDKDVNVMEINSAPLDYKNFKSGAISINPHGIKVGDEYVLSKDKYAGYKRTMRMNVKPNIPVFSNLDVGTRSRLERFAIFSHGQWHIYQRALREHPPAEDIDKQLARLRHYLG